MTCFHRVGIVAKYSYIVIVKAIRDFRFEGTGDMAKKKGAYNKFSCFLPYTKTGHIEYHSEIGREV